MRSRRRLATSITPIPKRKPLTRLQCRHRPAGRAGYGPDMMGGDIGQMMRMMNDTMQHNGGGMDMMPGQRVEGRVAYLKAELGITDAQLRQWNAFADAMRNGAKTMQLAMAAGQGDVANAGVTSPGGGPRVRVTTRSATAAPSGAIHEGRVLSRGGLRPRPSA